MCAPSSRACAAKATVLDPGRGRTKTARLWVYVRDERPYAGTNPPAGDGLSGLSEKDVFFRPTRLNSCFRGLGAIGCLGALGAERVVDALAPVRPKGC